MPRKADPVKQLKLSEPQKFAILKIGAEQVKNTDENYRVKICRDRNGSKGWYWTAASQMRYVGSKSGKVTTVRYKTYPTLIKRGLIEISDDNPSSSIALYAWLTAAGWEAFDILARDLYNKNKAWSDRFQEILAEEEASEQTFSAEVSQRRKILKVHYEKASRRVSVQATTAAEAQAKIATMDHDLDFSTDYWPEDSKDWQEMGDVVTVDKYGRKVVLDSKSVQEVLRTTALRVTEPTKNDSGPDSAAGKARKRAVEEMGQSPWTIAGIKEYVEDGKLPPALAKAREEKLLAEQQKLAEEFGGRLITLPEEDEAEPATDSEPIESNDLQRFAFFSENE